MLASLWAFYQYAIAGHCILYKKLKKETDRYTTFKNCCMQRIAFIFWNCMMTTLRCIL